MTNTASQRKALTVHHDVFVGVVLLAFCAVAFGMTTTFRRVPAMLSQNVPPTFFPRLVLMVLAALSLVLIAKGLKHSSRVLKNSSAGPAGAVISRELPSGALGRRVASIREAASAEARSRSALLEERGSSKQWDDVGPRGTEQSTDHTEKLRPAVAVTAVIITIAVTLVQLLGMLLTVFLITVILPVSWGERRAHRIAILAVGLPLAIHFIFTVALGMRFPRGALW